MRRLTLALALAISPFVTRVARAQDTKRDTHQSLLSWLWRDKDDDQKRGHDDDKKCEERRRGNPSEKGRDHRADPRDKGHKDCDKAPPPSQTPPPQDPPPSQDPAPPPAVGHTTITGSLFHDIDTNGVFDSSEFGLAGWTVELTGPVNQTALSDGNGFYSFAGLPAGTYAVCVSPPMGWNQTLPAGGPSCATTFGTSTMGYSVAAPALAVDSLIGNIDFGFLSMP